MTQDEIKKLFRYKDGNLYNKNRKIGGKTADGYIRTQIKRKSYPVHRLIWIFHHGAITENKFIDHINRVRHDNRIENLRLVTVSENGKNRTINNNNSSGMSGVSYNNSRKEWRAMISRIHLGWFKSKYLALQARFMAEIKHGYN